MTEHAPDPDAALTAFRQIGSAFQQFAESHGQVTEADTRAKIIDKVLTECLSWPESAICREQHVDSGYLDYSLSVRGRPFIVIEAKRQGDTFTLPLPQQRKTLKLDGVLAQDTLVRAAIAQVRQYCDDKAVRYAVATNGFAWIIFRAVRDDLPWKQGNARVFSSLDYIAANFTDLWNLLSFHAVCSGSLEAEFGSAPVTTRHFHRVVAELYNADAPLRRNRLNGQLQPIIKAFFEDITHLHIDVFRSCYVHTGSLKVIARDLNLVISDAIPKFLKDEGTQKIEQSASGAGTFGDALSLSVSGRSSDLYLLLGGIGSGKTTFLRRFERVLASESVRASTYWFHVDFLAAPLSPHELEQFVWSELLSMVRETYAGDFIEVRRFVKKSFADKIHALEQTVLKKHNKDSAAYEDALSPYLEQWQRNLADYVPRLLLYAARAHKKAVVLIIDNVDQLAPEYQSNVFLLAQHVTRRLSSTTVVSLREESYYTATVQRTFTAYTSRKFHIASPHFRKMIGLRISEATRQLSGNPADITVSLLRGIEFDRADISEFLSIVQQSVFRWSKVLAGFIEAVCFGNMRLALEMFSMFLTSGATDVNKMLLIYRREGWYHVAFHEFLKSIMLGDRRYYKEEHGRIMNVFNCTAERNSSHFTCWRIVTLLLALRGESTSEGRGYVEIGRTIGLFENVFDNVRDVVACLDRLVRSQLVETNTRSTVTALGASHVRATSAGWYYVRHLAFKFAYLDLVLQDTPLNDRALEERLRQSVYNVDNVGDKEENKVERLGVRFDRVSWFLDYLKREEDAEFERFGLDTLDGIITGRIVPSLSEKFDAERAYIRRRWAENRAKYPDDYVDSEEHADDEFALSGDDDSTDSDAN